jgi:hypothetical protein
LALTHIRAMQVDGGGGSLAALVAGLSRIASS